METKKMENCKGRRTWFLLFVCLFFFDCHFFEATKNSLGCTKMGIATCQKQKQNKTETKNTHFSHWEIIGIS